MDYIGAVIDVIVALRGANRIQFRTAAGRIDISIADLRGTHAHTICGRGVAKGGVYSFSPPAASCGCGLRRLRELCRPPTHTVFFSDPS